MIGGKQNKKDSPIRTESETLSLNHKSINMQYSISNIFIGEYQRHACFNSKGKLGQK